MLRMCVKQKCNFYFFKYDILVIFTDFYVSFMILTYLFLLSGSAPLIRIWIRIREAIITVFQGVKKRGDDYDEIKNSIGSVL